MSWTQSFAHAGRGFADAVRAERNLRVHVVAMIAIISLAAWLGLPAREWVPLVLCFGLVISLELVNTAIERLADRVCAEHDELIRQAKDVAAAAVLVAALMSVAVGVLVLGHPLAERLAGL